MAQSQWLAAAVMVALAVFVAIRVAQGYGYLGGGVVSGRKCSFCGGPLVHLSGYDRSGPDYGGGSKEVDDFRCRQCGKRYRHIVHENFDSVDHWWGLKTGDDWKDLEEEHWPQDLFAE